MRKFPEYIDVLKQHGYTEAENISDWYFQHRREVDRSLFGPTVASDEFASKVRWKSKFGVACVDALKKHFADKATEKERERAVWFQRDHERAMTDPNWRQTASQTTIDPFTTIDLEDFRFDFDGRTWSLGEFAYSFQLGRIAPQHDLIGIDLSGLRLYNVRLVNICLAGACLDGAHFNQVELVQTTLPQASFDSARLMTVRARNGTYFNGADMSRAGVLGIFPLSDETLTAPFRYTEISYWRLVAESLSGFGGSAPGKEPGWEVGRHTTFMNNTVTGLTRPETQALREYITWYQFTMERIRDMRTLPRLSQIGFVFAVLATKHWTSYKVLASVALIIDLFFAALFCVGSGTLVSGVSGFWDCFYASTLIFTSLGVEGLKPISPFGQFIVIAEAIMGYLTLAFFVLLIARKVERPR
jgi:hypothetical protein